MTTPTPWITSLCETLLNCEGRFRTLRGVAAAIDAKGQPLFTVHNATVDFEVTMAGNRYLLRVPCGEAAAELQQAARQLALLRNDACSPFAECRYLRSEMTVFRSDGTAFRSDVILERLPEGVRLREFVRINLNHKGRTLLRRLLEGYAATFDWLEEHVAVHGHITADEIRVTGDGHPKLMNRIHTRGSSHENDRTALLELSLLTYTVGCDQRLFPVLWVPHTAASRSRILHGIRLQAEFNRQREIAEIARTLLCGETPDCARTEAMLHEIASTRFVTMALLYGLLLEEKGEKESGTLLPEPQEQTRYITCESAGTQSGGILRCLDDNEQWFYLDNEGRRFGSCYDYAGDFYEGRAVVRTSEGFGLLCSDGRYALEPEFEALEWYGEANVAVGSCDGTCAMYDRMGRRLTAEMYDWIGEPSEGRVAVRRDGRYGYIDLAGGEVTGLRYTEAYSFRNGRALVQLASTHFYIDAAGNRLK